MAGAQKTQAYLEIAYPGLDNYYIDEIKEFSYSSDVTAVGDQCTFQVVADSQGQTLRQLRLGARCKLRLKNPAVNGGNWTVKHSGRIVQREADAEQGMISVTVADIGWHLMNCHAPFSKRLRHVTLAQLFNPVVKQAFIDPTFGFAGARIGLDANRLNRYAKQGRAGIPANGGQLQVLNIIQVEPGESFYGIMSRYAQRENVLINVSMDDFLQVWNPDFSRTPVFNFVRNGQTSNVSKAKRFDDATTRYTEVLCVGECIDPDAQLKDPRDPNETKRRGRYNAPADPSSGLPAPLPFTHRLTFGDGEMYESWMAKGQAEWKYKQGLFESHYITVVVPDHFQGSLWLESDNMCSLDIPELDAGGPYYVAAAKCDSTAADGDTTTLTLRWPYLLSASFDQRRSPVKYRNPEAQAAITPGTGSGT